MRFRESFSHYHPVMLRTGIRLFTSVLLAAAGAGAAGYSIRTFAGSKLPGDGGAATAALIGEAAGIACDLKGNFYVADAIDHRVRRISPDGTITTWAGTGTGGFSGDGGPAAAAELNAPYGLAADAVGNLYIADLGNARVRRVGPDGIIKTVAGGGTLMGDGIRATDAALVSPRNVVAAPDGTLYISDFSANRVFSVTRDGVLHSVAGSGVAGLSGDGDSAVMAQLCNPAGLAIDASGWLYIADSGNKRIRRVANGRIGSVVSPSTGLTLYTPTDIAVDAGGNLYIADGRTDQTARVSSLGAIGYIGAGSRSLAIDPLQQLYLGLGSIVRRYSGGVLSVAAGTGSYTFSGEGGPAARARLSQPVGVTVGPDGVTYIADTANHRVRSVDGTGHIATVAGTGVAGFSGDGKLAVAAELDSPSSVAVDRASNLYILDKGNCRIRKVTPEGIITTVAGTGLPGYSGDGGPAEFAEFDSPSAIAVSNSGVLYVADAGNHRVRRIGAGGWITTVAGNGVSGNTGDGGLAVNASLNTPRGVAAGEDGAVYIADTGNRRIRRVNAAGVIEAVGSAEWSFPAGLAPTTDGSLLVADAGLNRIRRIDADGSTGTIAGEGPAGFSGDGGPALQGRLNEPSSVAVTSSGEILVADTGNDRIRILSPGDTTEPGAGDERMIPVLNAASLIEGPIAPGELVQLTMAGLGDQPAVSFDNYPAPLLARDGDEIVVQVPYEVAGNSVARLRLEPQTGVPVELMMDVVPAAPGVYATEGKGQAEAFNETGERNALLRAAPRGSLVTVYCTGEGQTNPAGITGQLNGAPGPRPQLEVTAEIAGVAAEVVEAGEAAGLAGVLELKVRVPGGFIPSGVVPLVVTIGGKRSQPGVTLVIE